MTVGCNLTQFVVKLHLYPVGRSAYVKPGRVTVVVRWALIAMPDAYAQGYLCATEDSSELLGHKIHKFN